VPDRLWLRLFEGAAEILQPGGLTHTALGGVGPLGAAPQPELPGHDAMTAVAEASISSHIPAVVAWRARTLQMSFIQWWRLDVGSRSVCTMILQWVGRKKGKQSRRHGLQMAVRRLERSEQNSALSSVKGGIEKVQKELDLGAQMRNV